MNKASAEIAGVELLAELKPGVAGALMVPALTRSNSREANIAGAIAGVQVQELGRGAIAGVHVQEFGRGAIAGVRVQELGRGAIAGVHELGRGAIRDAAHRDALAPTFPTLPCRPSFPRRAYVVVERAAAGEQRGDCESQCSRAHT